MASSLSRLGYVLKWVSKQLRKVEKDMNGTPGRSSDVQNVVKTYQSIDALVKREQNLASEFDKVIADAEYKALVDTIQNHRTTLTPELAKATIERLRKSGASEEDIKKSIEKLKKSLQPSQSRNP